MQPKRLRQLYVTGFILSLGLTLSSYLVFLNHNLLGVATLPLLFTSALIQFLVQAVFFLHLDSEKGPRFNLITLLFAVMVIFILVAGTLWIMGHLNYNLPSDQYVAHDEGISF